MSRAVLIEDGLVRGTLGPDDVSVVRTPILEPDTDVDAARITMQHAGVNRVLVAELNGKLLGVVRCEDLPAR